MTVSATLAPLPDPAGGGTGGARDFWAARRGPGPYPSPASLRLVEAGPEAAAFLVFRRVAPGAPDWRVDFAGERAAGWLGAGDETLLSRLDDRRMARRLAPLFELATANGEEVRARIVDPAAAVDLTVLPVAADHAEPDGVFCAVERPEAGGRAQPDVARRPLPPDPLASDLMTTDLYTVGPDTPVPEIVRGLLARGISAAPVVDDDGRLVGIVSEADLAERSGEDPDARPSWWSILLSSDADLAGRFVRVHGLAARDVMTSAVVTVGRDTPLPDLVRRMARDRIRRVVVADGAVPVGIVSRTDVLRAQADAAPAPEVSGAVADAVVRERLVEALKAQPWFHLADRNVVVIDGVACFWGLVQSEAEIGALRIAALEVPGIRAVEMKAEVGPRYPLI